MFSKSKLEDTTSDDEDIVRKFMMQGVYKVDPEKTKSTSEAFSSMFEHLRTFKKIESSTTNSTSSMYGGMIPAGAIEASVKNEGVIFGERPVYRIARTTSQSTTTDSSKNFLSKESSFDPFRVPSIRRGPKKLSSSSSVKQQQQQKKNSSSQPPYLPAIYDLERLGHFFTKEDVSSLKSKIETEFKNTRADFEFDDSKWKWDVYAYDQEDRNQCCHVSVRMFRSYDKKDKLKGNTIVEFNKRKGCGWMYHRWFAPLFNKLVHDKVTSESTEKLRCTPTNKMKMMECSDLLELKPSDLLPLIGMAKAHCSAVQAEAFREIASLGRKDHKCHEFILQTDMMKDQKSMSQNGILGTIREILRSDVDVDVSRCAASTLRVLCSSVETRKRFREANETHSLIESLCGYLKKSRRKLSEKQTQRECVHALRLLKNELGGVKKELDRVLTEFQDLNF